MLLTGSFLLMGVAMNDLHDGLKRLREPFEAGQINKLPKPYSRDSQKGKCQECGGYHGLPAVHLDYVGHAALTDRLLQVDPEWTWEPVAMGADGLPQFDSNGGLWIRLTILGVARYGYGDADGKRGGNAVKEAIGDALRNAGMRFGAALDLWHKGDLAAAELDRNQPVNEAPPLPDDGQVQAALAALVSAESIDALQSAWQRAGATGATRDPRVTQAKDKRKRELSGG